MSAKPPDSSPPRGSKPGAGMPGTRVQSPVGTPVALKCPSCGSTIQGELPFCGKCGSRVSVASAALSCPNCGRQQDPSNRFCPGCGTTIGLAAAPAPAGAAADLVKGVSPAPRAEPKVTLLLLDRAGQVTNRFPLHGAVTTIGRQGADINFPDDAYLSPVHAQFVMLEGVLTVRDLGSRNGTWVYIDQANRLSDGDMILIGSQVLRYRRLGYPGPRPPEVDATRRLGSLTPNADIACLTQLRADGSGRDVLHLSPGRTVKLGREQGDWQFPYDPSMSGVHALVRSEDADFVVADAGSRNGVAVAVRGDRQLQTQTRLLIGDQMVRVEIV